jgi:tetratricopeptide (TPR) repeat protein
LVTTEEEALVIHRHPGPKTLERFLDGGLGDAASQALQRHLFLCPACERRLLFLLPEATPPEPGTAGRDPLHRLLDDYHAGTARRRQRLSEERDAAAALWLEIEPLDAAQRRLLIGEDARFQSWGFFELLVERGFQAVLADARQAEGLLRLALEVTEQLPPAELGAGPVEAAKARAWTHLGNALRSQGDLRQAAAAFARAESHLSRSWLDPLDEALLLELEAPLRRAQRRFAEALESIDGAIAIYREINEPNLQGRALMIKGVTLQYRGDVAAAADCYRAGLLLLEEPRLLALSRFNLAGCLHDAGHSAEAAALLPEARRELEQWGLRRDLLRLRWMEAKVAAATGQPAVAEEAFLAVRRSLLVEANAFDAALISLDLAALYLRQGRAEETKRLAAEIVPVFRSLEVHRDALAAVFVFQQAAEMEQLTLGLVDEVAAYLRQARHDPHLRFRAEA